MNEFHIAEINIARMKGVNINDPVMQEFVENLEKVNAIAEESEGFVWRLNDEANNATNLNPYNDEQVIVNLSVWESIENLERFMYKTLHSDFLKRSKQWFQTFDKVATAMWWTPKGTLPSVEEAVAKLYDLQQNGPSEKVFDFKNKFAAPSQPGAISTN